MPDLFVPMFSRGSVLIPWYVTFMHESETCHLMGSEKSALPESFTWARAQKFFFIGSSSIGSQQSVLVSGNTQSMTKRFPRSLKYVFNWKTEYSLIRLGTVSSLLSFGSSQWLDLGTEVAFLPVRGANFKLFKGEDLHGIEIKPFQILLNANDLWGILRDSCIPLPLRGWRSLSIRKFWNSFYALAVTSSTGEGS